MLQTIKEAKSLAKGLRREVLNHTADELGAFTHVQWLTLMAKAAGYSSWNVLEQKLQAEQGETSSAQQTPAKTAGSTYLNNEDGSYDFSGDSPEGWRVLDGFSLKPIQGSLDNIPAIALLTYGKREDGKFQVDHYDDESEMLWDDRTVQKSSRGQDLYVDEDGNLTESSLLVLLPEAYSPYNDEAWPVRDALVTAYRDWLLRNTGGPEPKQVHLSQAWEELGLKLTAAEEAKVLAYFE